MTTKIDEKLARNVLLTLITMLVSINNEDSSDAIVRKAEAITDRVMEKIDFENL